ncbi:multiple organellar RNA editing factor 7, mitochondrial-like [Magnolia sinica]|uniref:multiple organellar RNA editing factor 7, mitochondrial-like n=1 Tax=Magnolia sinica TaxID=86752 RepID=UPI002659BC95|nr:multiple organellar RNA editing factor 7, mitochondrial-like [Magnolia sinica]
MILSRRIKTLSPFLISVSPSIPLSRRYRPFSSSFVNPSRLPFPPSSSFPPASRNIATDQMPPPSSDSSVTQSSRPPTEPIPPEGCDYEHWLVVMEPPKGFPLRDEIVQGFVETLAMVLGSKEEAKRSMYSVSTKYYYAFGCKVSQELSYKIKSLPNVRWVLPDSYLHGEDKDYGGEPFVDGKAVPYEEKYHTDWLRDQNVAENRVSHNRRRRTRGRSRTLRR